MIKSKSQAQAITGAQLTMERTEYTLPANWIIALINDDWTGLEDHEVERLNNWLERKKPGYCTMPEITEPYFMHGHDENRNEGADTLTAIFVKN